jgi:hypothetical protein
MKRLLFAIGVGLVALACDEPFPTYQEPTDVLAASVGSEGSDTLLITADTTGVVVWYEPLLLAVMVRNTYTQLLEGEALVDGSVNVTMTSPLPRVFSTSRIEPYHLVRPPVLSGTMALTPADTALFSVRYFPSAGNTFFLEGVPYEQTMLADSTIRRVYAPVTFQVDCDVRLFERVQPVRAPAYALTVRYIFVTFRPD